MLRVTATSISTDKIMKLQFYTHGHFRISTKQQYRTTSLIDPSLLVYVVNLLFYKGSRRRTSSKFVLLILQKGVNWCPHGNFKYQIISTLTSTLLIVMEFANLNIIFMPATTYTHSHIKTGCLGFYY